jgi:hypothetical protein
MIYELVLWQEGDPETLGYFNTPDKANAAREDAEQYFLYEDTIFQNSKENGHVAFTIIKHITGLQPFARAEIRRGKAMKAMKKRGQE